MLLLFSRPFLDMVYHALDSPEDDYHALFVLCLLYAMSHNKGRHAYSPRAFLGPGAQGGERRAPLGRRFFLACGGLLHGFSSALLECFK